MKSQTQSRKTSKGFTLAELLVAMAITVVLVTITVSLTATALDTWRGARNEVRASRQAKALLDSLSRDLESLVVRQGGNNAEWLRVISEQDDIGPEGEPAANATRLVFFTSAPDRYNGNVGDSNDDKGGDVSLVGYQLEYGDPIFGETENVNASTFVLYRDLVDPDVTFQRYLGAEDLDEAYRRDSGGGGARGTAEDYLCENIYEMTITFVIEYLENDELTTVRLPVMSTSLAGSSLRDFAITGTGIKTNSSSNSPFASGRIISVDLSATVLSDTGLRTLKNTTFPTAERKSRFLAQNSYQYTKSVRIPQP